MKRDFNQVIMPLNLGINIPEDDPVRKLNEICEELDYSTLNKTYSRTWRKFTTSTLFKILVYGYMNKLAFNIKKLCSRIESNRFNQDLFALKVA